MLGQLPPDLPRRKATIRLPGYDYRLAGTYFVTMCTQKRQSLFGEVHAAAMHLSEIGVMVSDVWFQLPETFSNIALDSMVIMPDHVHAILMLGAVPGSDESPSLGDVVRYFKGRTTNRYLKEWQDRGWSPLDGRLWQRQYHDRVVRNDRELANIRDYVETNPERWWTRRHDPSSSRAR